MPAGYFPIIYVRGFAYDQSEIDSVTDDPFCGFNIGSTHEIADAAGSPTMWKFEGPLVRLFTDEGYEDVYEFGAQPRGRKDVAQCSIWIFPYYDLSAATFGVPANRPLSILEAAEQLRVLVQEVKEATGSDKVHLVAHSMGGLICRSLIQKVYPEQSPREYAKEHIARLFTYATPHGGMNHIPLLRRKAISRDRFAPESMHKFLVSDLVEDAHRADPQQMPPSCYNLKDVFCLIGTNGRDYNPVSGSGFAPTRWIQNAGLRKLVSGKVSDGFVLASEAYVRGALTATVYRCHSGRYGIVNSEAGYAHLRSFLFGKALVTASIGKSGPELRFSSSSPHSPIQIDISFSVAGYGEFVHSRTRQELDPLVLTKDFPTAEFHLPCLGDKTSGEGVPFSINCSIHNIPTLKDGSIDRRNYLHDSPVWSDTLTGSFRAPQQAAGMVPSWTLVASWNNANLGALDSEASPSDDEPVTTWQIALPESSIQPAGSHLELRLSLRIQDFDENGPGRTASPPEVPNAPDQQLDLSRTVAESESRAPEIA